MVRRLPGTVEQQDRMSPSACHQSCEGSRPKDSGAVRPKRSKALRSTAAAYGGVPHGTRKQRPMQRIQVRQQRGNLGQERIAQNRCNLFIAAAARVANQLAHFHAKGRG